MADLTENPALPNEAETIGLHAPTDVLGPAVAFRTPRRRVRFPIRGWIAAGVIVALCLVAVLAQWLAPHPYAEVVGETSMMPPSSEFPLGTDVVGRDVLSRLIFGTQVSLGVAVPSVTVALLIGSLIGLISAWLGGWVDAVIMRLIDIIFAFPDVLLAIAMVAILGGGVRNLILVISILFIPRFAVIVRSASMSVKGQEYIEAARSMGARGLWINFRHIIPNIAPLMLVEVALSMSAAMLAEAGLSFLGLSAAPPVPSWGGMLREAQAYMTIAPWTAIYPSLAIFAAVLSINVLADAIRDAFDLKGR